MMNLTSSRTGTRARIRIAAIASGPLALLLPAAPAALAAGGPGAVIVGSVAGNV